METQELNEYDQQATNFLEKTETEFKFKFNGFKRNDLWDDKSPRPHFRVYLSRKNGHTYGFDFWGSINDYLNNVQEVKPYAVLAALDVNYAEDFEDFCAEFGYDNDSRRAYAIWEAVEDQSEELKALFTEEKIEMLQEIQ